MECLYLLAGFILGLLCRRRPRVQFVPAPFPVPVAAPAPAETRQGVLFGVEGVPSEVLFHFFGGRMFANCSCGQTAAITWATPDVLRATCRCGVRELLRLGAWSRE